MVMVNIGDKVRFMNDVGGGKVTRIINKKMVGVEDEDGFEIPTLISELVVIEPILDRYNTEKSAAKPQIPEPEKEIAPISKIIKGKDSPDFYLAFVAQNETNPINGEIETWLINDSNYTLLFNFSHFTKTGFKTIKAGPLGPNSTSHLENFIQFDLADLPEFVFQIIYFTEGTGPLFEPVIKRIKVNPVKFYHQKTFVVTTFFNKAAYLLAITGNPLTVDFDKLTETEIGKIIKEKEKEASQPESQSAIKTDADLIEIDLHINELIDTSNGLTNREILEIQLERFSSEMEVAIKNRARRIVFIHGIGQGTLKNEILLKLKRQYPKYYVQDASFKEYGYGATMVILRK